jgi:hypothetical protein
MKKFIAYLTLEQRAIVVSGSVAVRVVDVGKGHGTAWAQLRADLQALGFRVVDEEVTEETTPPEPPA